MDYQVTIYTRVYNTEAFLPQCLQSVIDQTYRNFRHVVVDNGCTDGCTRILEEYAASYPWVTRIRFEQNRTDFSSQQWINTPYFCSLDSDDWLEPNFLERMIGFLEENDLDLAITGTVRYFEQTHTSQILRKLDRPVVLTQRQFAQQYPLYWTFPSAVWATIRKTDLDRKADHASVGSYPKGGDTMNMLKYIEQCRNIGIDDSVLYHYRDHPKSVVHQYNPRRFDANIAFYEHAKSFLERHHTFDPPKRDWLLLVHLVAMIETLQLLRSARISDQEKLAECARIAAHPLTAAALKCQRPEAEQWRALVGEVALQALGGGSCSNIEDLQQVLTVISPRCAGAVYAENCALFSKEPALKAALLEDNWDDLVCLVMDLIAGKRYSKQYDLGRMMSRLIPAQSPLQKIEDVRFFRNYAETCMLILGGDCQAALDQMTGCLLEEKELYDEEQFLTLYLSLSALENHTAAFLFGKLQMAQLFLRQGRAEECRSVVDELLEMGLDNEDLDALRRKLEDIT